MHVHGDNLTQKENHTRKYNDEEAKQFLSEIRVKYDEWNAGNDGLKGPLSNAKPEDADTIKKRVGLFTTYKDFVDQKKYAEKFDSRSNLHSTVLEEFIYYLFRDMVDDLSKTALLGKSHTFKDIFFDAHSYKEMVARPNAKIETKDHDFVIGTSIITTMNCKGSLETEQKILEIPAVAIECKTYLDKTMLEGSSNAAEQLKYRNPNAVYIVVAEWLKLTEDVNLRKYKVNQIYVLRKQKNTDREYRFEPDYQKNPVYHDVVEHLFNYVRAHLTTDWESGITYGLDKGYLL